MARADTLVCTPDGLLKVYPCLSCLSEAELKQVLLMTLAEILGTYDLPEDTGQLFEDSACYECLSDKQLLQVIVSMFAQAANWEGQDMDDIRDKIKCMLCANPKQVKAALAYLLCTLCRDVSLAPT